MIGFPGWLRIALLVFAAGAFVFVVLFAVSRVLPVETNNGAFARIAFCYAVAAFVLVWRFDVPLKWSWLAAWPSLAWFFFAVMQDELQEMENGWVIPVVIFNTGVLASVFGGSLATSWKRARAERRARRDDRDEPA